MAAFTSLKPLNLILFDTYFIGFLYLFFTWDYMNCHTNSNIWQLFFYLILVVRLIIDQLENNSVITTKIYSILICITSLILVGMSIYESIAVADNADQFDRNSNMPCFQNRIILIGDCVFSYLLFFKDILVVFFGCFKSNDNKVLGDN